MNDKRTSYGRRWGERRQHNTSLIDNFIDYCGPERRSGCDRRAIIDRRQRQG